MQIKLAVKTVHKDTSYAQMVRKATRLQCAYLWCGEIVVIGLKLEVFKVQYDTPLCNTYKATSLEKYG